jgi:hypothetical protein
VIDFGELWYNGNALTGTIDSKFVVDHIAGSHFTGRGIELLHSTNAETYHIKWPLGMNVGFHMKIFFDFLGFADRAS